MMDDLARQTSKKSSFLQTLGLIKVMIAYLRGSTFLSNLKETIEIYKLPQMLAGLQLQQKKRLTALLLAFST